MITDILIQPFFENIERAFIIQNLFRNKSLWDNRAIVKVPYRNGAWFTLGTSLYLDLNSVEQFTPYQHKAAYFNRIMRNCFSIELYQIKEKIHRLYFPDNEIKYLSDEFPHIGFPGFSIMPPEETFQAPFAMVHKDERWKAFEVMPDFPFPYKEIHGHFSFTIPLAIPVAGGGMNIAREGNKELVPLMYDVGKCYLHSGLFLHQVREFQHPVTPLDWRITIQGHGFAYNDIVYLYW